MVASMALKSTTADLEKRFQIVHNSKDFAARTGKTE